MTSFLSSSELTAWLLDTFDGLPGGIIFDCDGVVIDSREANIKYYNYLRQYVGLPELTPEQENFVQMATVHQAIDAIFPRPLQSLLREAAGHISYERDILPAITTFSGLHALLDCCLKLQIRLGMDTNRMDGMEILMETCHLHGYFHPIILASDVERPKPSPEGALVIAKQWGIPPAQILFIGDSLSDKGAADSAGIPFVCFQTENLAQPGIADFNTLKNSLMSIGLPEKACFTEATL